MAVATPAPQKKQLTKQEKNKVFRNIIRARSALVLDDPFFGTLALRLEVVEDPPWLPYPTFATDGRVLAYDSGFASELTFDELVGIICHEVMHNAEGHPWRRDGRDPEVFNIACDFAIDPLIKDAKKTLPKGAHINPAWIGKSAEWIYGEIMSKGQPPDEPGTQQGPGGFGLVMDPRSDEGTDQADWQLAVVQAAAAARSQGKLPGSMERLVQSITNPRVDWRAALRQFLARHAKEDYTFRKPNRRYLASGLYLPSLYSETTPPVGVLWDTSGSRDDEDSRAECAAECTAIFEETKPERVYIFYVDDGIRRIDTFERGDMVEFHPMGGGGTDFTECFTYIEEHQEELELCCLIGITDLMATFPQDEPQLPVIWCSTTDHPAPWGETIRL
jgi:predicted metal-dependent peptidase